jgi:hypothetical protein
MGQNCVRVRKHISQGDPTTKAGRYHLKPTSTIWPIPQEDSSYQCLNSLINVFHEEGSCGNGEPNNFVSGFCWSWSIENWCKMLKHKKKRKNLLVDITGKSKGKAGIWSGLPQRAHVPDSGTWYLQFWRCLSYRLPLWRPIYISAFVWVPRCVLSGLSYLGFSFLNQWGKGRLFGWVIKAHPWSCLEGNPF